MIKGTKAGYKLAFRTDLRVKRKDSNQRVGFTMVQTGLGLTLQSPMDEYTDC